MRSLRTWALLAIAAMASAALLAACGSDVNVGTPKASTTQPSTPTTATSPTGPVQEATTSFRVYFLRTDQLAVAGRRVLATPAVATAAMRALLSGPTPEERSAGLSSAIPSGTSLRGVTVSGGKATVDLTGGFSSGGGSLSMMARLAQVTYTLTQFPTVSGVDFRLDGAPVHVFGGEGIILDHPATRSGFESITPAILVESPTPDMAVVSPLRVWGTANVFEAAFRLELLDHSGKVLASRSVQATSGTGTRGTFDVTLPFTAANGPATLNVFDLSAKDGSRQDQVSVPLVIGGSS